MIRLDEPGHTFVETLGRCADGISPRLVLKRQVGDATAALASEGELYSAAGRAGSLHAFSPFHGNATDVVIAALTKGELVKLYDDYFVPEEKAARSVYDSIMSAASEKCPFCGGIGTPRNLDHFLPKAFFPQFSVLPLNLVPSCRDCNMDGKGARVVGSAEAQLIQPYLDHPRFFEEQWVFASYVPEACGSPGAFSFVASPPEAWSSSDKLRVVNHFEVFGLSRRYAVKAAEHLGVVIDQIERLRRIGVSDADIRSAVLQPGIERSPFVNHWMRPMYQALDSALPLFS